MPEMIRTTSISMSVKPAERRLGFMRSIGIPPLGGASAHGHATGAYKGEEGGSPRSSLKTTDIGMSSRAAVPRLSNSTRRRSSQVPHAGPMDPVREGIVLVRIAGPTRVGRLALEMVGPRVAIEDEPARDPGRDGVLARELDPGRHVAGRRLHPPLQVRLGDVRHRCNDQDPHDEDHDHHLDECEAVARAQHPFDSHRQSQPLSSAIDWPAGSARRRSRSTNILVQVQRDREAGGRIRRQVHVVVVAARRALRVREGRRSFQGLAFPFPA